MTTRIPISVDVDREGKFYMSAEMMALRERLKPTSIEGQRLNGTWQVLLDLTGWDADEIERALIAFIETGATVRAIYTPHRRLP